MAFNAWLCMCSDGDHVQSGWLRLLPKPAGL